MADLVLLLEGLLQQPISYDLKDQRERREALNLARQLCAQLESPMDTILRISWQEPALAVTLKVCTELKVFDILSATDSFVNCAQLAEKTGADPILLKRLLRHIAAIGYLKEEEPDSYASTRLAIAFANRRGDAMIDWLWDGIWPVYLTLPEFRKRTHYKDPVDTSHGNWQMHMPEDNPMTLFEYFEANPSKGLRFAQAMGEYASDRGSWLDLYPSERLFDGVDLTAPLIVDVGGSLGHDLEKFAVKHPDSNGRLVVQDLRSVIENARAQGKPGIDFMIHDFFEPQPIKGARAYYLHSVLHDWSDDDCVKILINIGHACTRGYSKLLINESAIPNTGASPIVTGLDIILMSVASGRERSYEEWLNLLNRAGFTIVKIYTDTLLAYESVIEAELA